ncbi:KfrB domain-containing protein [Methylomonas sp. AM2-LC]|uniref:KfrB domain-containing protein n=1 Tax=Methylomonas sp. AM2-LC TaxID=3153301 RepID=UPI003265795B
MKKRLLVMNGSRIVETEQGDGKWKTDSVAKANGVKPGIYNISLASQADKTKEYTGVILHSDKVSVYQQVGKNSYVSHNRDDFAKVPDVGQLKTISYDSKDKAVVTEAATVKLGLSR